MELTGETTMVITPMLGQTMTSVAVNAAKTELVFTCDDGRKFKFFHEQDCYESVTVEDVVGHLNDLTGSPIVEAEEVSSEHSTDYGDGSATWTFYRFSTVKGTVTVRWLGQSNGYYSESVNFEVLPAEAR